jgi:hypothetical protein
MEREAIERLAMDLSAGELNEDVQTLFKEYLSEHPKTNKWLQDTQKLYERTEAAISAKIDTAYTGVEETPVKMKLPLKLKWCPIARWAAVIIFTAFLGASIGRWTKKPVLEKEFIRVPASSTHTVKRQGFNLDDLSEGFWRDKVTAMLNPSPAKMQTSSNAGPSLLERYKQYIKERHYE